MSGESAAAAVSVRNLTKAYGPTVAVDGMSFTVAPGEIFGIIGPNGAGKTTTVEILQGLRNADSGEVAVLGIDPALEPAALRRVIGSQLQEAALPDRLRVWEALDLFASLSDAPVDWQRLLDEWGLSEKAKAPFASLSGGQRQRLFVALALVNDPRVVFLDEMTTGLDPAARRTAWGLVRRIRERGTTVILVTHFMDEAESLCDRIAVIAGGRLVALDTPSAMITAHGGGSRMTFTTSLQAIDWIDQVDGVGTVERSGAMVEVRGTGGFAARVSAGLVERGDAPHDLTITRAGLEEVYLSLVGIGEG